MLSTISISIKDSHFSSASLYHLQEKVFSNQIVNLLKDRTWKYLLSKRCQVIKVTTLYIRKQE